MFVSKLRRSGPLREPGKDFLAEIVCADVDLNLAVRAGVQIAGANDFALLDEHDGIASNFDFTEKVGIEENGSAALALIANDVADEAAAHGVEAGSGLVEEDEFGLVNKSLGQTDALQHTFRKAAKTAVAMRCEADKIEEGGNAVAELRGSESAEPAMKREEFGSSQPVVETKIFGEEADLATDFDARERVIEDLRVAAAGLDKAEQHLDGGAFAGAVRAKKSEDLAATNLERKTTNGNLRPEDLTKAMGFDGQVIRRGQKSLPELLKRTG